MNFTLAPPGRTQTQSNRPDVGAPGTPGDAPRRTGEWMDLEDMVDRVARARDRDAFRELTRLVAPRLKARTLRCLRDEAQAEEVVQDVLVAVWRRADTFERRHGSAWAWIFGIARNRTIDHVRKESGHARWTSQQPDPRDPAWVAEPVHSPERHAATAATATRLRSAVDALPLEQRHIVEAAYFHDHSLPEIAARHGIALGTAKSRVRLAMRRLRDALAASETP